MVCANGVFSGSYGEVLFLYRIYYNIYIFSYITLYGFAFIIDYFNIMVKVDIHIN